MADIQCGDVVVDPMCGGGSIGIEVSVRLCVRRSVYVNIRVGQREREEREGAFRGKEKVYLNVPI